MRYFQNPFYSHKIYKIQKRVPDVPTNEQNVEETVWKICLILHCPRKILMRSGKSIEPMRIRTGTVCQSSPQGDRLNLKQRTLQDEK